MAAQYAAKLISSQVVGHPGAREGVGVKNRGVSREGDVDHALEKDLDGLLRRPPAEMIYNSDLGQPSHREMSRYWGLLWSLQAIIRNVCVAPFRLDCAFDRL